MGSITPQQAAEMIARLARNRTKRQSFPCSQCGARNATEALALCDGCPPVFNLPTDKSPVDKEAKLRSDILAFCARQWPVWLVVSARPDKKSTVAVGAHDLTIWMPGGKVLAIELKQKNGKITPEQRNWIAQMKMLDTTVHVCRSFADFESVLRDSGL